MKDFKINESGEEIRNGGRFTSDRDAEYYTNIERQKDDIISIDDVTDDEIIGFCKADGIPVFKHSSMRLNNSGGPLVLLKNGYVINCSSFETHYLFCSKVLTNLCGTESLSVVSELIDLPDFFERKYGIITLNNGVDNGRLSDIRCKIVVSQNVPTESQYSAMIKWLDFRMQENKDNILVFVDGDVKIYSLNTYLPEEIVNRIRRKFTTGRLVESVKVREVLNDLVNEFGLLESVCDSDACYLLSDGRILDTKGKYENHQHINIARYIAEKYGVDDSMNDGSKFMNKINAIRVTPWIPAITLPLKNLSDNQEDVLIRDLQKILGKLKDNDKLMVSNIDGTYFKEFDSSSKVGKILFVMSEYYYGNVGF